MKLLRAVLGTRLPKEMEQLERMLSAKDRLEYQTYSATLREAEAIFTKAERFWRRDRTHALGWLKR